MRREPARCSMLTVSVVIPILNAARTLPAGLAVMEQLNPKPLEILLVDNGSTDCSLSLIRAFERNHASCEVRVLEEPRRVATVARNTGIHAAKGDVIAFTDADCAPDSGWLQHLVEPFRDPAVGAVAGRVMAASTATILELFSALFTFQSTDRPARHQCWTPWEGGFPTANLAVRRDLAERLGGFDETVGIYGEDYDLCARLYRCGAVIVYMPEAKVFHYHRTTLPGMLCQAFGFGRSHPYLLRRNVSCGLWLDLPRWSFVLNNCPMPAWINLASADKKVAAILILGALYSPALLLLLLYGAWLVLTTCRRARLAGTPVGRMAAMGIAGLLVLKSGAMTAGRWWGSVKYGAICF